MHRDSKLHWNQAEAYGCARFALSQLCHDGARRLVPALPELTSHAGSWQCRCTWVVTRRSRTPTAWSSSCGGRASTRSRCAASSIAGVTGPRCKQIGAAGTGPVVRHQSCGGSSRRSSSRHTGCRPSRRPPPHTLEARGIRVGLFAHGGVRELAQAVADSTAIASGAEVFYPTSDAALRQPEHLAGVAILQRRFERTHAGGLRHRGARQPRRRNSPRCVLPEVTRARRWVTLLESLGHRQLRGRGGFDLPPGPAVLIGGSTMRCWQENAPPAWRRAYRHDAETPLEWSLRFLERGSAAANDIIRRCAPLSENVAEAARSFSIRSQLLLPDRPGLRIILRISARCISSAAIWSRAYSSSRMLLHSHEFQQRVVRVEAFLLVFVGFL